MNRTRTPARRRTRTVSHLHDPSERQADRAAEVVARGGSVAGWSFAAVAPTTAHRQENDEKPKGPSTEEKLKEGGKKVVEAALETETGKKIVKKVEESEPVKALKGAAESTPGKIIGGSALAGAVAGQIATGKNLPISLPDVPLGGGWSIRPQIDTPITGERHPGVTLTFTEPPTKGGKDDKSAIAAETAALRRTQQMFKSEQQKRQEKADEQAAINAVIAANARRFGVKPIIPLTPSATPRVVETGAPAESAQPESDEEQAPVQREPAGPSAAEAEHAITDPDTVDASVQGPGAPLDMALRRSMEARFGHDFGEVRIHDDGAANAAAARLGAAAYTVGSDVVFGSGRYAPQTPRGRRLLAHELAHVVQQRGTEGQPRIHRRSGWDTFLIWLGVEEGTWADKELHAYLDSITTSGEIDGAYDADNKARAIVAKWKAGSPGYDLLGKQKALLIKEMQDGPTLDEDEDAILDLLELSDAGDLRTIFGTGGVTLRSLDKDFQGEQQQRLTEWVEARFVGGRTALAAGRVEVSGDPVPVKAPVHALAAATFEARFDSDRDPDEITALAQSFESTDRRKAIDHVIDPIWEQAAAKVERAAEEAAKAGTPEERQRIKEKVKEDQRRKAMAEQVLTNLFLGGKAATPDSLDAATQSLDADLTRSLERILTPALHETAARARQAVADWKAGKPGSDLLGPQKATLVRDLLSGPTLPEDQDALLDLLELSDRGDIRAMFAGAKLSLPTLDANFGAAHRARFDAWLSARFVGGRAAIEAGKTEWTSVVVPSGAPAFAFDTTTFDARLDSDRDEDELIALVEQFSDADKAKVRDHLLTKVIPDGKELIGTSPYDLDAASTKAQKDAIEAKVATARTRVRKAERIVEHLFLGDRPASAADLTAATSKLDPAKAEQARDVLKPKIYSPPKAPKAPKGSSSPPVSTPATPTFTDPAAYRAAVEAAVPGMLTALYTHVVSSKGARQGKDVIQPMALAAKVETDAVFAQYYDKAKHPELRFGSKGHKGNLQFWYEKAERDRKAYGSIPEARHWMTYFLQTENDVLALNDKFAAQPEFTSGDKPKNEEAKILVRIANSTVRDKPSRDKILEIARHWGGVAQGKNVFVDLYAGKNADEDRWNRWEMFQTLIHEYLHTLSHKQYDNYAESYGTSSASYNTLIEGVDNVLEEVVWANVKPKADSQALRKIVEGDAYAKLDPISLPYPARYPSYTQAMRLVALAGIKNVYAAYFMGLVDRIRVSKADEAAAKAKAKSP